MKYVIKSVFFIFLCTFFVQNLIFCAALHISADQGITAIILNVKADSFSLRPSSQYFEISAPQGMSSVKEVHMCTIPGEIYNYDAGTEGFESIMWEYKGNIYKAYLNIDGIQGWRDLRIDSIETLVHLGPWFFEPAKVIQGLQIKKGPLLKGCVKN